MPVGSRRKLGLAFSDSGVLIAEVRPNGRAHVTAAAAVTFTATVGLNDPAALGKEISETLRRHRIRTRRAVIGLPARWLMSRLKPVPPAEGEALAEILRLTAERAFSADGSELLIDYIPPAEGRGEEQVLLLATMRRRVEQVRQAAEAAGLKIEAVTSSTASLALAGRDAARSTGGAGGASGGADLVVQLSDDAVEVAVRHDQQLRLLRHVPLHVKSMEPNAVAGELRRALGADPRGASAESADRLVVWDITGAPHAGSRIGESASGGTLPREQPGQLSALAHVNGELGPAAEAMRFAPAIAVALAATDPALRAVDFLHSRLAAPKKQRLDQRFRIAGLAVAVVIAAAVSLFMIVSGERADVADLQAQLTRVKPDVESARELVDKVRYADQWFDARPRSLDYLVELTVAFPERTDIWVTDITIREDRSATLSGKTTDNRAVLELLDRLQKSPGMDNVKLLYSRESGRGGEIAFSLGVRFNETASGAGAGANKRSQPLTASKQGSR